MADNTISSFDQIFNSGYSVNGEQFQIIYAYFRQYTSSDAIASNYSEVLFKISEISAIPVEELLAQFVGMDGITINLTMAYYLNTLSDDKTLLYGVISNLRPVEPVQRNIVQ